MLHYTHSLKHLTDIADDSKYVLCDTLERLSPPCARIILQPQVNLHYAAKDPLRCANFNIKSVTHLEKSDPAETSGPAVTQ